MIVARRLRFFAALLALTGVLMSQLALAAYACPGPEAMAFAATDLDAGTDRPCCGDGMPDPQPALCAAHCQQDDQALDKPAAPAVPAITLGVILPGTAPVDAAFAGAPPGEQRSLLDRITAPSLAVRHCCFRI